MEKIEHLYSKSQLNNILKYYNEIFKYLKVTWHFWVDDKIVDIKRWFVFDDSEKLFWDYLDYIHTPIKKALWKEWWLSCVKFILNNWKEVVIVEHNEDHKEIPEGLHNMEEYLSELGKLVWDKYTTAVLNILGQINVLEYEYFHSKKYQTKQAKHNILSILWKK